MTLAELSEGLDKWDHGLSCDAMDTIDDAIENLTRAVALLKRIEWAGMVPSSVCYEYTLGCAACEAREEDGQHKPHCELARLLAETK